MRVWTWTRGDWELSLRQRDNGRYEVKLWRDGWLVVERECINVLAATECARDLAELGGLVQQFKEAASA